MQPLHTGIGGRCEPGFERVLEAFTRTFTDRNEVGASVAVTVEGETVVDLWGGFADAALTRPWQRDTIVVVYSCTKGMVALAAHMLADRGLLDLEAPVVRYWPEFGEAGKAQIPVKWLLTHQAGLPLIEESLHPGASLEWDTMVHALERQAPMWEPGTKHGYHTGTFGWLVGEVVRRVAGVSVGQFVREEIAQPLGVDFFIGFGPEEDHRVADMIVSAPLSPGSGVPASVADRGEIASRSFRSSPPKEGVGINHREMRAAEIPAGNGHGNARSFARIYGALACGGEIGGVRLVSAETVEKARAEQVCGRDAVLDIDTRRSLGFVLPLGEAGDVRGENAFGHSGMGGSAAWADPDVRVGFGYVTNSMWTGPDVDPRASGLAEAVYVSLESLG